MIEKTPLVSVIMPAYNAEKYIGEAIESILNQTFKDYEFIILDDCSVDRTLNIINEYAKRDSRIKVLHNEENLKLAKTLNKGIKEATGKYIARMDADDISLPDRLAKQVDFMEKNPGVAVVGAAMIIANQGGKETGRRRYHETDSDIRKHIFRYSPFCHPVIMLRKDMFDKTPGYKHGSNPAEDYELYFQLGKLGAFANLKDYLIKYRVVSNSMTTGKLRKMELKTIKIRMDHFFEYNGNLVDLIYTSLQLLTLFLMPSNFRIKTFSKLRERAIR